MKFYPEMLFSPWHIIAIGLTCIAFIALIAGGYERKTILRSSGLSFLFFYGVSLLTTGIFMQEQKYIEEVMLTRLDERYEEIKHQQHAPPYDSIIITVGGFLDDDQDARLVIYSGNYHETQPFHGDIHVEAFEVDGERFYEETFRNVTLAPGERKQIDKRYTFHKSDTIHYQYRIQPSR